MEGRRLLSHELVHVITLQQTHFNIPHWFTEGLAVHEIITDGETGFLVDSADEAVAAVRRLPEISRRHCREVFETRFSVKRMADEEMMEVQDE